MTPSLDTANTAWMLTATALVLFMTLPGLALFYGGLVRSKNILSVLMQCFAIAASVSLLWLACGYSFVFSGTGDWLGNLDKAFLAGVGKASLGPGNIPEALFVVYQMTFAIITPALIAGAYAERMKFSAMLAFSLLWTLFVYVPVAHWVWGGGWLAQWGVMDFAGGIVVHLTAGVAALIAAIMLGKRQGFGSTPLTPHNLTMTATGAGMLWVGWFGFNAGSAVAADGNAAMALLTTHLSAATGALVWMVIEWRKYGKPSALGTVTGLVAGLGTITPASGSVGPLGAVVIGALAGSVCFAATNFMKYKLKVDDSLDVFPVHGVGGIMGSLLLALFAHTGLGLFSGSGYTIADHSMGKQFMVQLGAVAACIVFTVVMTVAILRLVQLWLGLRVSVDQEIEGLDSVLHNERGYDL